MQLLLPGKWPLSLCRLFCHLMRSEVRKTKHEIKGGKQQLAAGYFISLEALVTMVSMVLASTTSWGRLFQSQMLLGRKDWWWYWVRHRSCTYFCRSGLWSCMLGRAETLPVVPVDNDKEHLCRGTVTRTLTRWSTFFYVALIFLTVDLTASSNIFDLESSFSLHLSLVSIVDLITSANSLTCSSQSISSFPESSASFLAY